MFVALCNHLRYLSGRDDNKLIREKEKVKRRTRQMKLYICLWGSAEQIYSQIDLEQWGDRDGGRGGERENEMHRMFHLFSERERLCALADKCIHVEDHTELDVNLFWMQENALRFLCVEISAFAPSKTHLLDAVERWSTVVVLCKCE